MVQSVNTEYWCSQNIFFSGLWDLVQLENSEITILYEIVGVLAMQTCKICLSTTEGNEFTGLDDDILKSLQFLQIDLVCTGYISSICSYWVIFFKFRWAVNYSGMLKWCQYLVVSCTPRKSYIFTYANFFYNIPAMNFRCMVFYTGSQKEFWS